MQIIKVETKMGKNGMIQIPKAELEATGLREGDELCLMYLALSEDNRKNVTGEFMFEKQTEPG